MRMVHESSRICDDNSVHDGGGIVMRSYGESVILKLIFRMMLIQNIGDASCAEITGAR